MPEHEAPHTEDATQTETSGELVEFPRPGHYAEIEFDIDRSRFVTETLEVTDSQRLRVAARELSETHPRFADLSSSNKRKRIFDQRDYFVKTLPRTVTVIKDGELVQMSGMELVEDAATNEVFGVMEEIGHPTYQLLEYLKKEFGDDIPTRSWEKLSKDLILLSAWDEIKEACKERIADAS